MNSTVFLPHFSILLHHYVTAPQRNSGTVKQCDLIFKHLSLGNYHFPKATLLACLFRTVGMGP